MAWSCAQAVLLSVLESLVRHSETVVSFAAVMADALLPALAGAVGADVGGDMRFSCLKVLSDITAVLLTAPRLGAPTCCLRENLLQQNSGTQCLHSYAGTHQQHYEVKTLCCLR